MHRYETQLCRRLCLHTVYCIYTICLSQATGIAIRVDNYVGKKEIHISKLALPASTHMLDSLLIEGMTIQ